MKQNKYDDPAFFRKYNEMPRSTGGLDEAGEWPAFRGLLPDLRGKRLLDLGCGFGWHCRYAADQGALSVIGVDLSENMLARARASGNNPRIAYVRSATEDFDFAAGQFDVVISSLALHYIEGYAAVCRKVHQSLSSGGTFVFSIEHPVVTAIASQEWCTGPGGQRMHWPVDNYRLEGPRETHWLGEEVLKYHRTVASYINTLVESGFLIQRVSEPEPGPEHLARHPDWVDEKRRPLFLLIAAYRE